MATNGSFSQQDQYKNAPEQYPATSGATDSSSGPTSGNDLSKDEVGWYFVEQYYTTLSKSPEKLHLFYGKRSQFVSGLEAEVTSVSVGRSAIQERIKQLDFQDCKVRVSNVDSQASYDNIVIQVIGETSNKSAELKKFVQTFVLAQQPTGYFVLNDIFRYINEEGDEEVAENAQEDAAAGPLVEDVEMPKAQAATEESAAAPLDADVIDKKLEETLEAEPKTEAPVTNGTSAPVEVEEEEQIPEAKEEAPAPEVVAKEVEEEITEPEKPLEPVPSPVVTRTQSATKPAVPAQPAGPPKPLTWASRLAASAGNAPKPAVPIIAKTATPPAQPRAAPPAAQTSKPAQAAAPTTVSQAEKNKENAPGSEWQAVGGDHGKRQNRPQSISSPPEKEAPITTGYIRNVTDKVSPDDLRAALGAFGNLVYFDVNPGKNCAFVEYSSHDGYAAAAAANPHQVSGVHIYVEPRRPKAGAYGGNGYSGNARGGMNQRGRGGFPNRGRAGPGPTRGRGQPTPA